MSRCVCCNSVLEEAEQMLDEELCNECLAGVAWPEFDADDIRRQRKALDEHTAMWSDEWREG